ncbi:MAG: T9SS C-terminal target domain-containing protein, partial [Calditrichaeota bacterium]
PEAVSASGDADAGNAQAYRLEQNSPNPFNPSTRIRYTLQKPVFVKLTVYDILGRKVRTLVNGHQQAGSYTVTFDGRDLASGVYLYKLKIGNVVETRKMMLIR